jgi:hypothetical protein
MESRYLKLHDFVAGLPHHCLAGQDKLHTGTP